MSIRQLASLFLANLILYTTANGLLPLLPVYASKLQADPALIGYILAFAYFALALGTLAAGWWSDLLRRRKVLIVAAGLVAIPGVWLMSMLTNVWQLGALIAALWFLIGVGLTLINILTGLSAEPSERGKIFGILALTIGLGSLLGGLTFGRIAERWGYSTMFALLALFVTLWPLAGLFSEDKAVERKRQEAEPGERSRLPGFFYLLLLANIIAMAAYFAGAMSRSMAMDALEFNSDAISSTVAVSGAVTLPLPALVGWLSDRIDRKYIIAFCYLAGTTGLTIMVVSTTLWHFQVAFSSLAILVISYSVGSALVTDLVPREALSIGLPLFGATTWLGGIIGFIGTGLVIQYLGIKTSMIVEAVLPLVAIVLLAVIWWAQRGTGSSERASAG